MVSGDDHHIPGARQVSAVLIARATGPGGETAAMAVKHDRSLAPIRGRRPDVQEETVLALRRFVAALARLNRGAAEGDSITHSGPGFQGWGSFETVAARNRTGV